MLRRFRLPWPALIGIFVATGCSTGGGASFSQRPAQQAAQSGLRFAQSCSGPPTCFPPPSYFCTSSISSNFNGTPIPANDFIWLNSDFTVNGVQSGAYLYTTYQTIAWGTNEIFPSSAAIGFNQSASAASASFVNGLWYEKLPTWHTAGNSYLGGVAVPAPFGPPSQTNPITWTVTFASTAPVTVQWSWAAAVYSDFPQNVSSADPTNFNYNSLGVKPVDDNQASKYQNSDHAGTPEQYKGYLVGGARGGGGSDFTGSLSGTASCTLSQTGGRIS